MYFIKHSISEAPKVQYTKLPTNQIFQDYHNFDKFERNQEIRNKKINQETYQHTCI